ncbi:hypothetical protein F4679DRAFT_586696 [Xylaria curta]|nr:hypothetical protein F4679DRAFT_586696 [Xylaria curta]
MLAILPALLIASVAGSDIALTGSAGIGLEIGTITNTDDGYGYLTGSAVSTTLLSASLKTVSHPAGVPSDACYSHTTALLFNEQKRPAVDWLNFLEFVSCTIHNQIFRGLAALRSIWGSVCSVWCSVWLWLEQHGILQDQHIATPIQRPRLDS